MKIVAMSDSHGNAAAVEKVIAQNHNADGFYHLGDGWRDFAFAALEPGVLRVGVRGNCDMTSALPQNDIRILEGVRIAAFHGEEFYGIADAVRLAVKYQAKVVLHGHTHEPNIEFVNGVYIVCPGTLKYRAVQTYAVLELKDGGVKPELKRI